MTKKIIVAKGLCSPARDAVTATLRPYGVRFVLHTYSERAGGIIDEDNKPGADWNVAEVTVSDQAAAWTEYLLCRSGIFWLRSKPIEPRNLRWAQRWEGKMPQPWIEPGCKHKQPSRLQPPARRQPTRRPWWQRLFR